MWGRCSVVTLVSLWDQLSGHWYLGQCLSPSLPFLTGICLCKPHRRFVFCFFFSLFSALFFKFNFDPSPPPAPQFLLEALQGNHACSTTLVLPVFPYLTS